MRFAYFYFMQDNPDAVQVVAPQHAAYWREMASGYPRGPFADRSGGLITFEADSLERAQDMVAADPFVRLGLLAGSWLKEWAIA